MPTPPIIIIKKKGGHGGHHGGAWKVAYADFVTAMMALFIVLWLLSSASKPEKEAISGYFKDPSGTSAKAGSALSGSGESISLSKDDMPKLKQQLQQSIQKMNDLSKLKDNIQMTVTAEGLRIELLESEQGAFFESGSTTLNKSGQEIVALLAKELSDLPNKVSVEGHTDAKPFSGKNVYSNWELSTDRANAARRVMQQAGLMADRVSQVRGFADQRLRNEKDPFDSANRRISIIVQYINTAPEEPAATDGEAKEGEGKAKEGEKEKPPAAKAGEGEKKGEPEKK